MTPEAIHGDRGVSDNRQSTFDVQSPLAHRDVQWTLIVFGSVLLVFLVAARIATAPTEASNRSDRPVRAEGNPPRDVGDAQVLGVQIDINRARSHELALLPRVGPVLAARIISDRNRNGDYISVKDLQRVHGIGPKILDEISHICVVRRDGGDAAPHRR